MGCWLVPFGRIGLLIRTYPGIQPRALGWIGQIQRAYREFMLAIEAEQTFCW